MNRERGTMLTTIDPTKLNEVACAKTNAWLREQGYTETIEEVYSVFGTLAVSDTDAGLFVVNGEGVGYEVTDEKPLTDVHFGTRWTDTDGKGHRTMSGSTLEGFTLSPDEVREMATGDEIDLADLVRSFGDRLEVNFDIWRYRIGGGVSR